jgi:7-carboxy-7-deazaguanine synthase
MRRVYSVKSIFVTLQGEGHHCGRRAVFCRFAGCNLWNGREASRASAICQFCDTDFVGTDGSGGGRFEGAEQLTQAILESWASAQTPFVVFTGGEPTLQLDAELLAALHRSGAEIAIETNGTRAVPEGVDWICVSPKAGAALTQRTGDELKVAWPQQAINLDELERLSFSHRFLQPIDGPALERNIVTTLAECRRRKSRWRPSWQMHKLVGLP